MSISPKSSFLRRFGGNLRRERMSQGMSQKRLAELSELHIRTVQRIEAGELSIRVDTVSRLRAALGCPWDRLFPR